MNKIFVSWDKYVSQCESLASIIKRNQEPFDAIITLARGGFIPATIIAHELNIDEVFSIGASYYSGDTKREHPYVYQNLPQGIDVKRVLVVDEICDSGRTWRHVQAELQERGCEDAVLATLCLKEGAVPIPTYWMQFVEKDEWIVFPYEKE